MGDAFVKKSFAHMIQRACGHATDPCNRPMALKGTIGNPPRGPGPPLEFSGSVEVLVKPLPGRVWGANWCTIQTIPLAKKAGKTSRGPIPSQNHVFRAPILGPKGAPRPPGTQTLTWGFKNGSQGQKYQSCRLKNQAESSGRCPKRSHMLQVMAPKHF